MNRVNDMDWKSIISTVAPWIGTALGGPLGGLAVTAVGNALGMNGATTDTIKQALAGVTPDQMIAIKNADNDFALKMQALGFKQITDLEGLAVEDRKDARAMGVSTKSLIPGALSAVVTIGYFGILVGMMTGSLRISDSQALLIMLGSLTTAWGAVMAYWFGTTSSSARKTEIIAKSPAVDN